MNKDELIKLSKELKLTDNDELLAKILISYSTTYKVTSVAFGRTTGAGSDGFIGIYQNQLVGFDTNLLGNKPTKERFRFNFDEIDKLEIKKGILNLNNQFHIHSGHHHYKIYFTGKRRNLIEAMHRKILSNK
jgi:hypothetical protein